MTDTQTAQRAELKAIRAAIDLYELKIEHAKLTHLRPLALLKRRVRLERDIAREECQLDERTAEDFARQLDDIPARVRTAKREEVGPLVEELAEYNRRKKALLAEMANGQERLRV